ncbi:MAG: hypothetical protein Q8K98_07560 [Bacteroidota bacterium]|nr:hypothetical protein [Bacteroidota bacterium]
MTKVEQHKIIEALKDYYKKMNRYEVDEFDMFRKRDYDDEDLDSLSKKKLIELYEKYVPARFR